MSPVQDIDSIYFTKDQEILDTETQDGIRIFIDSKGNSDCKYYRWTIEEWWKFTVPDPKLFDFVNETTIIHCTQINQTCWRNEKSNGIIIKSTDTGISNRFEKKPVLFIASDKSDRLLVQYCIQVRQLSISRSEYSFWDRMRQINESGGDIFDKQPFQITGNVHNINKPEEQVLGYFQVSGAAIKKRYITSDEVSALVLPTYTYECDKIVIGPDDFVVDPSGHIPPPTFDHIYKMYKNSYVFVEQVIEDGILKKLIFATPVCADCTLRGHLTKPDFWIDLD